MRPVSDQRSALGARERLPLPSAWLQPCARRSRWVRARAWVRQAAAFAWHVIVPALVLVALLGGATAAVWSAARSGRAVISAQPAAPLLADESRY